MEGRTSDGGGSLCLLALRALSLPRTPAAFRARSGARARALHYLFLFQLYSPHDFFLFVSRFAFSSPPSPQFPIHAYIYIYIGINAHHHPPVNLKRVSHNFCHVFRIYIHKGVLHLHTKPYRYIYIYTIHTSRAFIFVTTRYCSIYIYSLSLVPRRQRAFPALALPPPSHNIINYRGRLIYRSSLIGFWVDGGGGYERHEAEWERVKELNHALAHKVTRKCVGGGWFTGTRPIRRTSPALSSARIIRFAKNSFTRCE